MIYVMGDIHGNMEGYTSIMQKIDLQPDDRLYVLGDVIDRKPYGASILLDLINRPNATVLLGNHELMMRNVFIGENRNEAARLWYRNHGMATQDDMLRLSQIDCMKIFARILSLPLTAEVSINGTDYLLVHAAPPELRSIIPSKYKDDESFAVWTRLSADTPMSKEKTVIFGHTPTNHYQEGEPLRIWYGQNRIGIDCGSGHDHPACRIACIRLDDMLEYYSE